MKESDVDLMELGIFAAKLFKYVDVLIDEDDNVLGITMTNSKAFLGYVGNFEDAKKKEVEND